MKRPKVCESQTLIFNNTEHSFHHYPFAKMTVSYILCYAASIDLRSIFDSLRSVMSHRHCSRVATFIKKTNGKTAPTRTTTITKQLQTLHALCARGCKEVKKVQTVFAKMVTLNKSLCRGYIVPNIAVAKAQETVKKDLSKILWSFCSHLLVVIRDTSLARYKR